ncbi:epoxyqueuosine reductase [Pelosinus sp. sgz500959]|uniref:epoxyqueuosine reductase n=1 Tax=Pelosinus sp. sgz500959 TaxID=3242472 RepID=UPI00366F6B13
MQNLICKLIKEYVKNYPQLVNSLSRWQEPLIGFADAADERFLTLRGQVSPNHAIPTDFLEDARTVIAYFIPFAEEIIKSNYAGTQCSKEWVIAYIETNKLILDLNTYLRDQLCAMGYESTVIPATHNFNTQTLLSDWSHRHIAYIAGLGSFGLNNMLITEKGCCGRLGSLVTNLVIEPSKASGKENCLYKHGGRCKKCVNSCVNQALTLDEFDRHRCYTKCLENAEIYNEFGLGDVCGKCLVNMPCSTTNPARLL